MMMLSKLVVKRKVAMASRVIGLLSSKRDEIRMVSTTTTRDFTAVESKLHFGVIGVTVLLMTQQQQQQQERASYSVKCEARRAVTQPCWQDPSATLAKTIPSNPENDTPYRTSGRGSHSLSDEYNVNWEIVIGKGAYASVYPARSLLTGEKVALKKISKRNTTSSSFKTEKEAMLRIYDNGGHPNIAGLRGVYEDDNNFYVILDLVSGGECMII